MSGLASVLVTPLDGLRRLSIPLVSTPMRSSGMDGNHGNATEDSRCRVFRLDQDW